MHRQHFLRLLVEAIVGRIAQKRMGLVMLRTPNGTNRERLFAFSPPIGGQCRWLECASGTSMLFCGPRVTRVFRGKSLVTSQGKQAMIRPKANDPFSVDVNAHIDE